MSNQDDTGAIPGARLTKRDFLKRLAAGGAGLAASAALGDEYVNDGSRVLPGSCGDPRRPGYANHVFPLDHTMTDGPSCGLRDGKVYEPAREIPVFHETDVVVVGGGPAGFAAAIAAARTGAKVALVERYGSLGGLFTNGMVLIMLATSVKRDGKYEIVTKGVCEEFMRRAVKLGPHVADDESPAKDRHWQPTVDPEAAKYLMDRMIEEAKGLGVRPVVVTPVSDAFFSKDGRHVGHLQCSRHAAALRGLAAERGYAVVDLDALTSELLKSLGPEKSRPLYMVSVDGRDVTHLTKAGAERVADMFCREAVSAGLPFIRGASSGEDGRGR